MITHCMLTLTSPLFYGKSHTAGQKEESDKTSLEGKTFQTAKKDKLISLDNIKHLSPSASF